MEACQFRCGIGSRNWREKWDKKQPPGVPRFDVCPFGIKFSRSVDIKTQSPLTLFEMVEFDLRHNHPLTLAYDRI